ncbi:hypothetical protein [Corallococcus llansteffanensis]|uniref:Alpha/beta hydrolase n=1 Tax=Corallococcus llansteffanensis TaxID=2316731 RepID=A0A3A8NMP3_9BACT|nr:hypothetical protein [Corallococcus llansteffanensis]RKH45508.1 hypothetical protein D7V93_35395 [Corallococcus llansteffanensis]
MKRLAWPFVLLTAFSTAALGSTNPQGSPPNLIQSATRTAVFTPVDDRGQAIDILPVGDSLTVGAQGLEPNTVYELRFAVDAERIPTLKEAVGFARATTDAKGALAPHILWFQSGVVGCPERAAPPQSPYRFPSFERAEAALDGRTLLVTAQAVAADKTGKIPPMELPVGEPVAAFNLPIKVSATPRVYPSTADGCLLNAHETGRGDLYVTGSGFRGNETVEVSIVPNQRAWREGDAFADVSGDGFASAPKKVVTDASGRFTVPAWNANFQRRGVYDIIARRPLFEPLPGVLSASDVVSYGIDTGVVLYLLYPVGGPTMDIAGRPLNSFPYFEFADSFADTSDPVWGAVDPTYVPAGHPGGTWAAYYVVNHRSVLGWTLNTNLVDVSGGIEIQQVKAGCVNGTDIVIWQPPLVKGSYDVVVDFGSTVATTPGSYSTDGNYNDTVDFLDGSNQIGFQVAKDPYALGTYPIGTDSYSVDNYFPTMGGAANVDLRAVVRYPAVAAGAGTAVAAGTFPVFVIQHGNHRICYNSTQNHATCTNRVPNHQGYMRLLDTLASNGVIAISIDAYDLSGPVPQWIPERGQLILKHLELWSHLNNAATYPTYPNFFAGRFNGKLDMTKISVSGHSRGGEASVSAYMQNTAFNIVSVSSIAPVDGQLYTLPAGVPYFVILPAADGDVTSLSGAKIYDRALGTKSSIDVYGASHNLFNTVWAADGDDSPSTRNDYITAPNQQRIGESYLSAFTRIYLKNETVYADMMRGQLTFPSTAGFKIYATHHENSHTRLNSGSTAGFTSAGPLTLANASNPAPHSTSVLRATWTGNTATATFTVPVAQRDTTGYEVLSFRVAQTTSASNPASGTQDFRVELATGATVKATSTSLFDVIPKPYVRPGNVVLHTVLTTVRIPLHTFIMNGNGVTLTNIDTVRLRFTSPSTGDIYVDDVEFSR